MTVQVVARRLLVEPPVQGDCDDPECATYSPTELERQSPSHELRPGVDVLLVATYQAAEGVPSVWRRVCAPCDERALRRWMAES